jgi:hypothetical protein
VRFRGPFFATVPACLADGFDSIVGFLQNTPGGIETGSARGIGKAIAERYARLGASVIVNYAMGE